MNIYKKVLAQLLLVGNNKLTDDGSNGNDEDISFWSEIWELIVSNMSYAEVQNLEATSRLMHAAIYPLEVHHLANALKLQQVGIEIPESASPSDWAKRLFHEQWRSTDGFKFHLTLFSCFANALLADQTQRDYIALEHNLSNWRKLGDYLKSLEGASLSPVPSAEVLKIVKSHLCEILDSMITNAERQAAEFMLEMAEKISRNEMLSKEEVQKGTVFGATCVGWLRKKQRRSAKVYKAAVVTRHKRLQFLVEIRDRTKRYNSEGGGKEEDDLLQMNWWLNLAKTDCEWLHLDEGAQGVIQKRLKEKTTEQQVPSASMIAKGNTFVGKIQSPLITTQTYSPSPQLVHQYMQQWTRQQQQGVPYANYYNMYPQAPAAPSYHPQQR